jgi:AraC-like DNA-binding protein
MTTSLPLDLAVVGALVAHQAFVIGCLSGFRDQGDRRPFGVVLFLALNIGADLTVLAETFAPSPWWFALRIALLFGFGPALLFYAHAMTGSPIPHRRRLWLTGLTLTFACLALSCLLPLLSVDFPAQGPVRVPLLAWTGVLAGLALFSITGGLYLWATLRLLRAHLSNLKALFSNIENQTLSWLRWSLFLLAAAWLVDLADTACAVLLGRAFLSDLAAALIEAAWVYPLTGMALRQHGFRRPLPDPPPEAADVSSARYEKSALSKERMARIAGKLDQLMRVEMIHRNPGLSLKDVQARTGVSRGHLSQTLNTHIGSSFYDYVNAWRVTDACRLLEASERSITDIAMEAGFQSRSTFNAAFLKARGISPSRYRREAARASPS